jgi:hypothetical protein
MHVLGWPCSSDRYVDPVRMVRVNAGLLPPLVALARQGIC